MRMSKVVPAVVALLPVMLPAQSVPPVKMGLWQGTTVTKMTGLSLPPEVVERMKAMGRSVPGAEPRTVETQSCLTPEKWKETFNQPQQNNRCQMTNLQQDAKGMSADMACQEDRGRTLKGHLEMNFISSEKVHGTMHAEMTSSQQPQPVVVDITFDRSYVGPDCQGITPDTPKIVTK